MLVCEYKASGKSNQFSAVDEAIRTVQFIRNKAIRLWMDGGAKSCYVAELHHIDGNHTNWKSNNLEALHRECHQHQAIHSQVRVRTAG
ncbi:hypothetical protein Cha6605_5678 [Chamaesiphon minutus PCC 6605]|uniref:HNH nuclease domain-containing protein n=1 Tax=Chamaesiphon minutus (strain ATCC 27169 / PCC 6605) TaxID=1173020 RepID=K9UQ12_CHAP6|nr:hypothetical protein Cha6605_5678 [Chamaesiphon minutus PCC 6605]